jgi:hypothetical protein
MQNTLSIRYAFCACAYGVLCYLESYIVFKAKVARHVRILHILILVIIIKLYYLGTINFKQQAMFIFNMHLNSKI